MDTMPESFNEGVTQASEHCTPKVAQRPSPKRSSSTPLRRSERIRLLNVQGEQHSNSLEKLNLTGPVKCHSALTQTKPRWLTGACSLLNQEKNMPSSGQNRKEHGRQKKLIPEDGGNSNAQAKDVNVNDLNVCTGERSNMSKQIRDVGARPISCPIWRGSFSVCSENFGLMDALAAHMSNKACTEVFGVACLLPALLQSQMIPRLDVWPKCFNSSAPTDNVIDLYIFPENERSEAFDSLLNYMTGQDLAMKAVVDDIVLLVFTSLQLPYQYWRTLGKYYLWAVISGKNAFFPYPQDDHHSIGKIVCDHSSNLANDVGNAIEDEKNLSEDRNTYGFSHQMTKRKSDPTHILPCTKSKLLIRSQMSTLARKAVEEQPPTGRTVTEGFAEDRFYNSISDGFTKTRVLTDSIPHETDATERSVVEKDPVSAANEVIHKQAPGDAAIIAGAFPSAISKSTVYIPDVEEAITAIRFHEVLPNSALQGHQEGEGANSLDKVGIQSIGASLDLHVESALNKLIRGASEIQVAPAIAHNHEGFSNSVLQECDWGQEAHSLDREGSQSIGTSVVHMTSAFDEMSSDEVTPAVPIAKNLQYLLPGSSHQMKKRKSDPTHIRPCRKSKMLIRSQISTLAEEAVEEQRPTGRTVTEGFAKDRTYNFISDGFTETRVLTDSMPHEADATERRLVEKDPESAANEVLDTEAPADTAIIVGAFPSAISKSMVYIPDVEEAITATRVQEVLLNSTVEGHQEGEGANSLYQVGFQSIGASLDLRVKNALTELIRGASEIEAAPAIAHNHEIFSNSALQECDGGQEAHSLDGEGSQSIGTSVLHMASAFDEMSSDEVTPADNSAEQVGVYSVKRDLAPILRAIIDKHGDIAQDCPLKCSKMLTSALERVCKAVQDFESVHFINLRSSHLKSLYSAIKDSEFVKLDVKWLHNRYNEVMETVNQIRQYKSMIVDRRKNIKVVESKKRALELKKTEMKKLQSDIQSLESEVVSMTAKNESLNGVIGSVKSKSKQFYHNSLVDGLL